MNRKSLSQFRTSARLSHPPHSLPVSPVSCDSASCQKEAWSPRAYTARRSSWRVRRTGCGPTPSTRAPASSRELPTRYDSTPPFPPHLRPSTRSPTFHKPSSPPTRYPTFYTLSPTMSYSTFYTTFTPPFTHHLSLLTPSSKVSDSES